MYRFDCRRAVDDPETLGLLGREGQVTLPDPVMKGPVFLLETVFGLFGRTPAVLRPARYSSV
jgi:hypothetical protein